MAVYLDTSVLVAAFSIEASSPRASALLALSEDWLVSDWTAAEFSAAIRTKARRGDLDAAQVMVLDSALDRLIQRSGQAVPVEVSDHNDTRKLVISDGLIRAQDALHLVIARRKGAALATFDLDQARAAGGIGVDLFPL